MKELPGFRYIAKRKQAFFDGYVAGTNGKVRRRRTIENVTRDQALTAWKIFRDDLVSGRALEGPLTLQEFFDRFYSLISAGHGAGTRKTQGHIIKNHLLRYFGDTELTKITTIRVIDFKADMRERSCSASYTNDAVRVLKLLLRQAVERDVIADYPIKKCVPREKEAQLHLELKVEERTRFFAAFDDEAGFRRHIDTSRELGPVQPSEHFGTERRFGGGMWMQFGESQYRPSEDRQGSRSHDHPYGGTLCTASEESMREVADALDSDPILPRVVNA